MYPVGLARDRVEMSAWAGKTRTHPEVVDIHPELIARNRGSLTLSLHRPAHVLLQNR